MPYKLISLVILLFFLIINKAYSENEFILPVKKPSIFKKIEKNITTKITNDLPQKKPILQSTNTEQKVAKEKKEIKKKVTPEKIVVKVDSGFLLPQKILLKPKKQLNLLNHESGIVQLKVLRELKIEILEL